MNTVFERELSAAARRVVWPAILVGSGLACSAPSVSAEGESGSDGLVDADQDGSPAGVDCDDADQTRHPGASETCNGIDDDCDGVIDEDAIDVVVLFTDDDQDGFGGEDSTHMGCPDAEGFSDVAGDCDDTDPAINPGATEVCNGIDDDCDAELDEGADFVECETGLEGICGIGVLNCVDATPVCEPALASQPEHCNGYDDDCDGEVDEGAGEVRYRDEDADGHGNHELPMLFCGSSTDGYVPLDDDCDDADPLVHPDQIEICNNKVDDNCDGSDAPCTLRGHRSLEDWGAVHFDSTQDDARFGFAVDASGDFNGDGNADLAVGSPGWKEDGSSVGAVFVFFGPWNNSLTADEADVKILGDGFSFGAHVAAIPDVNGDSGDELAVGAGLGPMALNLGFAGSWPGKAYLFETPLVGSMSAADAKISMLNGEIGARSQQVWDGKDILGPGTRSLVVGSQKLIVPLPASGEIDLAGDAGAPAYAMARVIDDFDGDGSSDLVVGFRPLGIPSGSADKDVLVFRGPLTSAPAAGEAHAVLGMPGNEFYGVDIVSAGDTNADGRTDLWVAIWRQGFSPAEGGVVRLVLGSATPIDMLLSIGGNVPAAILLATPSAEFSGPIASSDLNCDGLPDLMVASHLMDAIFYSPIVGASDYSAHDYLSFYQAGGSSNGIDRSLWPAPDRNDDGCSEIVVGAPYESLESLEPAEGRVWVVDSLGGL